MNKEDIIISEEFIEQFKSFLQELDNYGWEINEDGDIVEKKSQKLVWEIYKGYKNE